MVPAGPVRMNLAERLRRALAMGHDKEVALYDDERLASIELSHAPAAVLIAITDRSEPGVILTRRADHLRTHAGQVALPGGRVDDADVDEIRAALREAEEEIALSAHHVDIVGVTDSYKTFTGFDIAPVIGVIPPDLPLHPHQAEVDTVFEVPLSFVLSPNNYQQRAMEIRGSMGHYYEMFWDDYRIWGVTAAIFVNLSKRLSLEDFAK